VKSVTSEIIANLSNYLKVNNVVPEVSLYLNYFLPQEEQDTKYKYYDISKIK
jgi:hypothetical protein